MDGSAVSAGPWLVLGAVVGLLAALVLVLASITVRRGPAPPSSPASPSAEGWLVDDLPGWLDDPAGAADGDRSTPVALLVEPPRPGPPAEDGTGGGRALLAMAVAALMLIGVAATVAALAGADGDAAATARAPARPTHGEGGRTEPAPPVGALPAVPEDPEPGDPGAGRLADAAVPVGSDGVLAEVAFEGVVLERRAVGVTAAYPTLTLTAAAVPEGPAVAHLELPTFNCLTDAAPADPVAAGCLRTPVEHADLPTPALSVTRDGDVVEVSGRFATYVRPSGSDPQWTGRVYPVTVTVSPDGGDDGGDGGEDGGADGGAEGVLEIGAESAAVRDEPGVSFLRLPG